MWDDSKLTIAVGCHDRDNKVRSFNQEDSSGLHARHGGVRECGAVS